jgi:hypothetical protein
MIRNGILLAIAILLAGCAGLRNPIASGSEQEERQVIQLISYAQSVAGMPAEQQRREYKASNEAFARDKDAMSRIRLGLLLTTPGASFNDITRASTLLEPMAATADAASPLRSLARLVYVQLSERTSEQKRANQMREKLDALKEVERTILERGQESQPRRR